MKYRFYTKTRAAWDAMYREIASAQKSIYWECYILMDDTRRHDFYQLLQRKARSGVAVKVVVDSIGMFWGWQNRHLKESLERSGVEVLYFNRLVPWWNPVRMRNWWFTRNHRKVLVVDERVGFLGGVNVGHAYARWFDLHVRLEGAIVQHLLRSFARSYEICGGTEPAVLTLRHKRMRGGWLHRAKSYYLAHVPGAGSSHLQRLYQRSFDRAKDSITIVTPYFIPHGWFLEGLARARARGVRVRVLLPKDPREKFFSLINRLSACQAQRRGIDVRFSKSSSMNHSKAMLIDESEAMIGSTNIDANSIDNNFEANIVFRRRDMVRELSRIIRQWSDATTGINVRTVHRGIVHRVLERFVNILQPYL
ncbi:hypothetical protein HZA86_03675 [Candidatus Uhrbacteria bacterium]|nr:hypothetical protein [Candidatus Uhrbacteria bacterium]